MLIDSAILNTKPQQVCVEELPARNSYQLGKRKLQTAVNAFSFVSVFEVYVSFTSALRSVGIFIVKGLL